VLYLDKSRGSWRSGDYGDVAGRWPLDWYYRCNIVNNIPLSWCARGSHKSRYLAGLPLRRPTSTQQHQTLSADPSQALPVFTVEYSFFSRTRSWRSIRCYHVGTEHGVSTHYPILCWVGADCTLTAISCPILYRELSPCTYMMHTWMANTFYNLHQMISLHFV